MNKKYLLRTIITVLTVLAALVDLVYILGGLVAGFTGFTFFYSTDYGLKAVTDVYVLFGLIFWPILVGCLIFSCIGFLYLRKTKDKFDKTEYLHYVKKLAKRLGIVAVIAGVLVVLGFMAEAFMQNTYYGIQIQIKLGKNPQDFYYVKCPISDFLDTDENSFLLLEKNEELIYVDGIVGDGEDVAFLQDFYYEEEYSGKNAADYFDMDGADHYELINQGFGRVAFYKKGNLICVPVDDDTFFIYRRLETKEE